MMRTLILLAAVMLTSTAQAAAGKLPAKVCRSLVPYLGSVIDGVVLILITTGSWSWTPTVLKATRKAARCMALSFAKAEAIR